MDQDLVRTVLGNVRHPLNHNTRIKFTARAMMFIVTLFTDKYIDVISLNYTIQRIAQSMGCLDDPQTLVTMTGVAAYLICNPHEAIDNHDLFEIAERLDIDKDNDYKEVEDTIYLLSNV